MIVDKRNCRQERSHRRVSWENFIVLARILLKKLLPRQFNKKINKSRGSYACILCFYMRVRKLRSLNKARVCLHNATVSVICNEKTKGENDITRIPKYMQQEYCSIGKPNSSETPQITRLNLSLNHLRGCQAARTAGTRQLVEHLSRDFRGSGSNTSLVFHYFSIPVTQTILMMWNLIQYCINI